MKYFPLLSSVRVDSNNFFDVWIRFQCLIFNPIPNTPLPDLLSQNHTHRPSSTFCINPRNLIPCNSAHRMILFRHCYII